MGAVRKLRILLSEQTLSQIRELVASVLPPDSFELVSIEDAVSSGDSAIDIAFISRDVTGLSTKHELAPELQNCYAVLRRSTALQWIHIHSAGADRPIYVELRQRGVVISTSSGVNAEAVTQSALAGLLSLARGFAQLRQAQQSHVWQPLLGARQPRELRGQTAVLVGWGPIGQLISEFLTRFGLQVTVIRQSLENLRPAPKGVSFTDFARLPDALAQAQWLLLACPLTETTRQLVDAGMLKAMPKGGCVVNVARGEVIVEADLIVALQAGHLAGAYLDVFEHEPLPANSPLWDMPNVIVTPHSAGHSDGNKLKVQNLFLSNLRRWVSQEPLVNAI